MGTWVSTPLWKCNGTIFFDTNYSTFIFCSLSLFSYVTYVRWSIWIIAIFDWISITGYIPVTLWKLQLHQNPTSRLHDLCNVRGWHRDIGKTTVIGRVVGMQTVSLNYYKLSKTCHHAQIDAFVTAWGCAKSKEAIQDHWLVDNSTASVFGAYAIMNKMQAVQVGTMEQSIRRARGQALL